VKPAFLLFCLWGGVPEKNSMMMLSSINNCIYFRDYLTKQSVSMKDNDGKISVKKYECICKLINVNKDVRLW